MKSNSHYISEKEEVWEEAGGEERSSENRVSPNWFLKLGRSSIDATALDNQSWLSRFGKTTHILVGVGGIASARKGRTVACLDQAEEASSTLTSFFVSFRFSVSFSATNQECVDGVTRLLKQ